jgi:hypothetical protein
MRASVVASTCKYSIQNKHISASVCGCAGLVDDPADEDDFEVELEAVDVVSFALPFAMGFNELEFESIPVPTTLNLRTLINNRSQNESGQRV